MVSDRLKLGLWLLRDAMIRTQHTPEADGDHQHLTAIFDNAQNLIQKIGLEFEYSPDAIHEHREKTKRGKQRGIGRALKALFGITAQPDNQKWDSQHQTHTTKIEQLSESLGVDTCGTLRGKKGAERYASLFVQAEAVIQSCKRKTDGKKAVHSDSGFAKNDKEKRSDPREHQVIEHLRNTAVVIETHHFKRINAGVFQSGQHGMNRNEKKVDREKRDNNFPGTQRQIRWKPQFEELVDFDLPALGKPTRLFPIAVD